MLDLNKHGGMVQWLSSVSDVDEYFVVKVAQTYSKVFPISSYFTKIDRYSFCLGQPPFIAHAWVLMANN